MSESGTENRLGKLETRMELMAASVDSLARNQTSFQEEWRTKAEEDRKAHRSARLTIPQIVAMIGTAVVVTGTFLGGLMYLVNTQVGAARVDLAGQIQAMRSDFSAQVGAARQSAEASSAQLALAVRGQGDGVTAANAAIQATQRDQGEIKVKLGLVEQMAMANSRFIDQAQSIDAHLARGDERLKALEQFARDLAARRSP